MARKDGKIRYAVVGAGHIAQAAVLPAFAHAENSELTALVSGDPVKHQELGKRHNIPRIYSYEQYSECLGSGEVDAVYIALPNHMHREYSVRAARAGVHVLCEKPMAVTEEDCEAMIRAAEENRVKLMVAYRLHFEEGNLEAIRIAKSGRLGNLRIFSSTFSQQVVPGNIRVAYDIGQGGGSVYDMGTYCINAARYLFQAEPEEVTAISANNGEERFHGVDEMTSVIVKFPEERLAVFTTSFGAADISSYTLAGTEGYLRVDPAYDYQLDIKHHLTAGSQTSERTFPRRDQFAPELIYFSGCVLSNSDPEPSGAEGLADVRVIEAIYRSAADGGNAVKLPPFDRAKRPTIDMSIYRPPIEEKPPEVRASSPSGKQ